MCYMYSYMEQYSALERKEILTQLQSVFGDLVLSEINQSQKEQILCDSTHRGTQSSQIHTDRKYNGGFQALQGRKKEELFNVLVHRISVLQEEKSSGDG